nr:MAG TPA: hypothetical protein [Caudoviricetes sp.]
MSSADLFPVPVVKAGRTCVGAGATITQPKSLPRRTAKCTDQIIT